MPQPQEDLASYLEAQGHGVVGTDLFRGDLPDKDDGSLDNIVSVTDTGGLPNQLNDPIGGLEIISFQVLARNRRQEQARQKLLDIQSELHQLSNTDLGSFTVLSARAVDRPGIVRRDEKSRWLLVSNYEVMLRPS